MLHGGLHGGVTIEGGLHTAVLVGRLLHPLCGSGASRQRDTFHEACASADLLAALGLKISDWVVIFQRAPHVDAEDCPCLAQLVEAGEDAVVCPLPASRRDGSSTGSGNAVLYLPTNLIECLGVTPGKSAITVAKLSTDEGAIPLAGRVVLARVHVPQLRQDGKALRSFFSVPRVLRRGEVFSVPPRGLPSLLCKVEGASSRARAHEAASGSSDEEAPQDDRSEDLDRPADFSPGMLTISKDDIGDSLTWLASRLLSFQVKSIQPHDSSGSRADVSWGSLRVSDSTEVLLQGTCRVRGLPYITSHLFCRQPPPLPPPLQEPCRRLLGSLAPALRGWVQSASTIDVPHTVLVAGARGCGKRVLWRAVCDRLGLHLLEVNCLQLAAQNPGAVDEAVHRLVFSAVRSSPAVLCLRRLQALAGSGPLRSPSALALLHRRLEATSGEALRRAHTEPMGEHSRPFVVLAGTCEDLEEIAGPIRNIFQINIIVGRPDLDTRRIISSNLLSAYGQQLASTCAQEMAKLTAGLSYVALKSVCSELTLSGCMTEGATLVQANAVEQAVKRLQSGSKVAVTLASKVRWDDVGGLQNAKDEIMNCITLPLTQGQMFEGRKVRSGVLLFGPPGTGKTLLARAVATECKVHFLSVKGPELLSMYIGESERNVRDLFQKARELQPCVLFFDELDSLAPARGRGSDSGGVMDRIVSQLITELDSLPATVFLVGATNRPDLLDRSLLRPGRLDRTVYLGVAVEKSPLLRAITRNFKLDERCANTGASDCGLLEAVAKACPLNFTGADVSVLCADAYAHAQKEHLSFFHDIAAKLDVSITTLLLFLEDLERNAKARSRQERFTIGAAGLDEAFSLVWSQMEDSSCRAQHAARDPADRLQMPAGLLLFQGGPQFRSAFVLVHNMKAGSKLGSADFFHHTYSLPNAAADESNVLAGAWKEFCETSLPAAGAMNCAVVHNLCPWTALDVRVGWRHFQEALTHMQPSVSLEDLERYEQLAREYQHTQG